MNKIELKAAILAPAAGPQYVIIMQEVAGNRRLPIVIGLAEAQAIALELENISRSRPLTHDLFVNTLSAFGIDLIEIFITKIDKDGVFHSELICEQAGTGTKIRIDSRTSDAIALALRFKCKIFVSEEILEAASFKVETFEKKTSPKSHNEKIISKISNLNQRLDEAIIAENYELAAQIKKEIRELKDKFK
ncbi:MAG: bifunctional nuclease family protein [Bacteroidales bacterium]|nr:bifunctional nuclease family protein [Bacteroidales bacterium]